MEIPIYFNFDEFESHYLFDFLTLKEQTPDLVIDDYYTILSEKYVNLTGQYTQEKNDQIQTLNNFLDQENFSSFLWDNYSGKLETIRERTGYDGDKLLAEVLIDTHSEIYWKILIIADKINRFILNKIIERQHPTETETPELDFSENPDKVKLIMLEKLGIIDFIKSIQTKPETISHTSEILSAITGIGSKTLNTYLYPMLRPHPDKTDPNSPYKNRENLLDAEKIIQKLKIKNIDADR